MATAPMTSPRPFNGLSGMEIKKAILADISRKLDADQRFSQHLSYPLILWKWKLAVDAWPPEIGKFEINTQGKMSSDNPRPIDDEEEVPEQINLKGGREVLAPQSGETADNVRRETGQPVPTPKVVRGPDNSRVVVEAVPIDPKEVAQTAAPATQTDVPSGKGVVARRTSVRTRANPTGVVASEPSGSAPTEEDAAKIAERIAKENAE